MPELRPLRSGYYIWKYVPSTPLSAIAAILWVIAFGMVSRKMYRSRTWFCTAFIIGCFMEFIGFCARAGAANKTDRLMPYIIQSAFILLPPTLFAATIYMCLGRIIRLVGGDHLSIIKPQKITKIFVGGDLLSFLVQGGSTGFSVMADKNPIFPTIGEALVVGGLAIQLLSFGLFGLTALIFHTRLRKSPTARSFEVDQSWTKVMRMLYAVSVLIIIRSIFRIVEYVMGLDGYPLTHEWTLYVFDTIPMLAVALLFFLYYPDKLTIKSDEVIQLRSQVSSKHDSVPRY